ncbi:MAG: SCO family protein [Candidatus Thiodiazotropha sp. (ex Monitilora ramsayi)]|nr:SCO family protein [Candidatus Thiodiazotropha sp. (ex Monitilora ramsayi)]
MHSIIAGLMEGVEAPQLLIDDQVPHHFTPSAAQLKELESADLFFWVGPELEPGLAKIIDGIGSQVEVIELLSHQGLKILTSRNRPDQRDPFFWLDNRNLLIVLNDLTRLLQQADPLRTHLYERNRRKMLKRLARIDREYEYGYRGMKAGLGVQYYDTLQYFEQAYALKVIDHVAASPDQTIDAAALLMAREKLISGEARCLLTETGFPAEHVELLLSESSANHGMLNSLGFGKSSGPDLYFEIMDHNTDTIKRCLDADMQEAASARQHASQDKTTALDGIGSGQFLLTDHFGRLVSKETMRGKYQIVYFGYTYCPDICPTSLSVMFQALDILGDKSDLFQPYFITIDPERDTVKVLKKYVQYYDKRLIGVTGSSEMVDRVADQFKARYEKVVEDTSDPTMYLMDHTASLYILDPEGRFLTKFAHGIEPEILAQQLRELLP